MPSFLLRLNFIRDDRVAAAIHELAFFSAISAPIGLKLADYCLVDAHTADIVDTILLIYCCNNVGIGWLKLQRQARRRGGSGGGAGWWCILHCLHRYYCVYSTLVIKCASSLYVQVKCESGIMKVDERMSEKRRRSST